MASLYSKNAGKKLLQQTKLLNGSGTENLKLLSQKEIDRVRRNLPVNRNNQRGSNG